MAEERKIANVFIRNKKTRRNFEIHYAELVKEAKPIVFSLIDLPFQKNTQFTGREKQLAQIYNYLAQQNALAITAQAIAGLGGVGKSQLAIEYAYQAYEKKSYQIIWFMNGQNLDGDYLRLAAQLKIYGENKDDIIERTKRKLEELGNYLLIIDDAENYEKIRPYLPQTGSNGHVLITTRHRLDWPQMLELGVFTLDEALEYFKKVVDFKEEEKEDVVKLAGKYLGLLPLALAQSGAFIKQTGVSIKEYIDFFETKRKELWGAEDKARDYSQTIAVTWDITINRIKQKYPQAEDLLRGISFLASTPNRIDQNWLSGLIVDEQIRLAVLGQLADYSILERHQQINNFLVHSLVQQVTYSKLQKKENIVYFIKIAEILNNIFPYAKESLKDHEGKSMLLPHLEHFLLLLMNFNSIYQDEKNLIEKDILLKILFLTADAHTVTGNAKRECQLLEMALDIDKKVFGEDHLNVAATLNDLGGIFLDLGELDKAQEKFKEALNIEINKVGRKNPIIASTLFNMGTVLIKCNEIFPALEKFLEVTTLLKECSVTQVIESKLIVHIYHGLAVIFGRLGILKKEFEFIMAAVKVIIKDNNYNHLNLVRILNDFSAIYGTRFLDSERQGRLRLLETVLKFKKLIYGNDHPEVAITLDAFSETYFSVINFLKAKKCLEQAFEIRKNYFGLQSYQVIITLCHLISLQRSIGENTVSLMGEKKLFNFSLKLIKTYFSRSDMPAIEILHLLSNVHVNTFLLNLNLFEVQKLRANIINIIDKHNNLSAEVVIKILFYLGTICSAMGDFDGDLKLANRALIILKSQVVLESQIKASILIRVANAYSNNSKNQEEILQFREDAFNIYTKFFQSNHSVITFNFYEEYVDNICDILKLKFKLEDSTKKQFQMILEFYRFIVLLNFHMKYEYILKGKFKNFLDQGALALESHLKEHPEDKEALILLGHYYAIAEFLKEKASNIKNKESDMLADLESISVLLPDIEPINSEVEDEKLIELLAERINTVCHDYEKNVLEINQSFKHDYLSDETLDFLERQLNIQDFDIMQSSECILEEIVEDSEADNELKSIENISEAIKLNAIKAYLEKFPADILMHNFIADIYYENGELEYLIFHYEEILKLNSEDANNLHKLGCIYHIKQKIDQAKQFFEMALSIKKTALFFCDYGLCLFRNNEIELAISQFLFALDCIKENEDKNKDEIEEDEMFYGPLEKPLLNEYLMQEMKERNTFCIISKFLAFYLIIRCYEKLNDVDNQKKYTEDFGNEVENSADPIAYRLLSYSYGLLGDIEKADEMLVQALQLEQSEEQSSIQSYISTASANSSSSNIIAAFFRSRTFAEKSSSELDSDENISEDEMDMFNDEDIDASINTAKPSFNG